MNVVHYAHIVLSLTTSYYFSIGLISPNPVLRNSSRAKLGGFIERQASGQHLCLVIVTLTALLGIAEVSSILAGVPIISHFNQLIQWTFSLERTKPADAYLTKTRFLGAVMVVIGGSIRMWTFKALGKFFTFQIGVQKNQTLITHGLYSVVRHPAYTALLFTHPGHLLWQLMPGSWVRESGMLGTTLGWTLIGGLSAFCIATGYMICINRPPQEDIVMRAAFGREWDEWAKKVPYRLVPGIY